MEALVEDHKFFCVFSSHFPKKEVSGAMNKKRLLGHRDITRAFAWYETAPGVYTFSFSTLNAQCLRDSFVFNAV